ncbi:MAG TPA: hypothetical protein V6D23_20100 [Candidatus Obscuribacterales bacterium]
MKQILLLSTLLCAMWAMCACTVNVTPNPGKPATPAPAATQAPSGLKFLGQLEDKVSPADSGGADGTADYAFSYSHDFGKEVTLREITLSQIEEGKPLGSNGWTTGARDYWLLQVSANGKDLNQTTKTLSLGNVTGKVDFKMYGATSDPELFAHGASYELLIEYIDGGSDKTLTARVTL